MFLRHGIFSSKYSTNFPLRLSRSLYGPLTCEDKQTPRMISSSSFHPFIKDFDPCCIIPGLVRYFCCTSYLHLMLARCIKVASTSQHVYPSSAKSLLLSNHTWHILCVHLPSFLRFHSLSSLDPFSFLSSRECVRLCVCHYRVSSSRRSGWGAVLSSEPSSCIACHSSWKEKCVLIWCLVLVFASVAEPQPLGRPGSSTGCCDSSRQQQAAGPGPPSGLPLSGTSCVCGHQPLVPPSPLCSKPPSQDPLLQCTLVGGNDNFCCPILLSLTLNF